MAIIKPIKKSSTTINEGFGPTFFMNLIFLIILWFLFFSVFFFLLHQTRFCFPRRDMILSLTCHFFTVWMERIITKNRYHSIRENLHFTIGYLISGFWNGLNYILGNTIWMGLWLILCDLSRDGVVGVGNWFKRW